MATRRTRPAANESSPLPEHDLPSTPSKAASAQVEGVTVMRDCVAGNLAIKAKTVTYLPKAPKELPANYANRLARSVFHNFTRRTVDGLVGLVFRVDPVLGDDVPAPIVEHWENIDNAGTHGAVFLRDLMTDALAAGHAAVLVDYPDTGGQRLTMAEERARGVRPYWVPLKKENLLSWRVTSEDGRPVLTQLVVRESTVEPAGLFGEIEQVSYRVFTRERTDTGVLVSWRLLRVTDRKTVVQVAAGTYPTQEEIPVAEFTTSGKVGLFQSEPPLLDLAFLNLAHYQQWSDNATSMHMTCVPILFTAGFAMKDDKGVEIEVGPNSGLNSKNPEGKAAYVSHDGAAIGLVRQALQDLKADIGALGIAMLAPSTRAAETAEAKRLDKAGSDSALSATARGQQDGAERCLSFHARYLGLPDGGSVTFNRDYEGSLMDPQVMVAYVQAAKDIGFPLHELLVAFQKGGRISDDVDLDALEAKMSLEMDTRRAAEQAEADLRAREAEAGMGDEGAGDSGQRRAA